MVRKIENMTQEDTSKKIDAAVGQGNTITPKICRVHNTIYRRG